MRTWERLWKTKRFFEEELCKGREFKAPVPATGANAQYGPHITDFTMAEPRVFLAWQPARPNEPGKVDPKDPISVAPSITIMPNAAVARYAPEHRFDRYQNVHRPQDLGQSLSLQILFTIYEPGVRLPGFADGFDAGQPDMSLLKDGTEPGLQTLVNWMDDGMELLLREKTVPHTDLILEDDNFLYSLYTDQTFIQDRRPLYQGFLFVEFKCHADTGSDHGKRSRIDRLLDEGEF